MSEQLSLPKSYNPNLDIVRLFAIIFVVTIHVISPFLTYPPFFATPTFWLANLIDSISRVGVPLFVMISGALMLNAKRSESIKTFLHKRLLRLGLPLILWNLIYLLWAKYFMHFRLDMSNSVAILSTYFRSYYHIYFLYLILGLSLITPVLKQIFSKISSFQQLMLAYCLFIPGIIYTTLKGFYYPTLNIFESPLTYFILYTPYYIIGNYLSHLHLTIVKKYVNLAIYILFIVLTCFLNYQYMMTSGWKQGLHFNLSSYLYFFENLSPTVIVMSLTLFPLFNNLQLPLLILRYQNQLHRLSLASFGIFLIHPIFIDLLDKYTLFNLAHLPSPVWLFMILKTVIVFTLSLVSILFLQKFRLFHYFEGTEVRS